MKLHAHIVSEGRKEFRERVKTWAGRIKVEPKQIQVRRMSRKWASCSSRRCVCFAEMLLKQPSGFQNYVIVHELLHLRVPNHGKLFKSLMSAYLPGWRNASLTVYSIADGATDGLPRRAEMPLTSD